MSIQKFSALDICHAILKKHVKQGDICIDATAGRGFDTAFLCEIAGESGHIHSFDIQQDAIDSTAALLAERGLSDRCELHLESHSEMDKYAEEGTVSCITFNFGWLPGGDHSINTRKETSIAAIEKGLSLLKDGGLMSLVIYYGRDTGFEEKDALLEYVKTIDHRKYTVIEMPFANRPNCPPIPVFIWNGIPDMSVFD